MDKTGGPMCGACPLGMTGDGTRRGCDVIRCTHDPCYSGSECEDTPTGFRCGPCPRGYTGSCMLTHMFRGDAVQMLINTRTSKRTARLLFPHVLISRPIICNAVSRQLVCCSSHSQYTCPHPVLHYLIKFRSVLLS